MSIARGFSAAAVKTADEYGVNAMQVFTKNPRARAGTKKIAKKEALEFKRTCLEKKIKYVVAHCSYLLNFAKPLPQNHWSIKNLVDDLERIHLLGGVGVVFHVGKHLELDYKKAEKDLVKNLKVILKKTQKLNNFIILENTAGQGSEMGWTFEQLAEVYRGLGRHKRIKFCLDTAHSFAAGYDWRKTDKQEEYFKKFDKLLGLENISCLHFNDSLKPCGSKIDRHENIGTGFIGLKPLERIAKFAEKHSMPFILETPEKQITHKDDIKIIKQWFK